MFKKTIEFEDFNGNKVKKDFYFHMSKAELLELAADGNGMLERIQRIIESNDGKALLKEFREIIWHSVGVRSEDGTRFVKDNDAKRQLFESPAYDELLLELCTNAEASSQFVAQLIPDKMQKEMQAQLAKQGAVEVPDPFKQPTDDDPRPVWMKEERNPTPAELQNMTKEEMLQAFQLRRPNPTP